MNPFFINLFNLLNYYYYPYYHFDDARNNFRYGIEYLNIETFSAKIKFGNTASEKLFEKLGFQTVSKSEVFQVNLKAKE